MFDRLTDDARLVMGHSHREAQRLRHGYIGTEHIFLGLLNVKNAFAVDVLRNLKVSLDELRRAVLERVRPGSEEMRVGQLPFTPRVKRILELAVDEATHMGCSRLGSEHLLLGLIREPEGIGGEVLRDDGLTPDGVREAILEMVGAETGSHRTIDAAETGREARGREVDYLRMMVLELKRGLEELEERVRKLESGD